MISLFPKSYRKLLVTTVLTALPIILLSFWPSKLNRQVQKQTSSVLHQLRGPRAPQADLLFIFLDSKDIADCGGWPISRDFYGYLVHALDSINTGTIVIDILFPRVAQYNPGMDMATADIFEMAGNVVLPNVFDVLSDSDGTGLTGHSATFPAPLYQDAAAAIGFANLGDHVADGKIPLIATFDGQSRFSLAVEAAANFLQATPEAASGNRLSFGDMAGKEVLSNQPPTLTLNYIGNTKGIPQIGFVEFLQQYPQLADSIDFSNKIVFVGLTAPGLPVMTESPYEENFPSTLIHLTAAENLIAGIGLRDLPLWQQFIIWLAVIGIAMFLLSRRWGKVSLAVSLLSAVLLLLFSYLAFVSLHYLTSVLYPVAFLIISSIRAVISSQQQVISEQHSAKEQLQSRVAAKARELDLAREKLTTLSGEIDNAEGEQSRLQEEIRQQQEHVTSLEQQVQDLKAGETRQPKIETDFAGIVHSGHGKMAELLQLVRQVSLEEIPVLISGETGTGKELIARAVHQNSARRDKVFVAVNCGAIAENLLESELFGHEKGSFTGAHARRRGRFELADGGTIFLDEISETSLAFQSRLLRVLQEGSFERLGGETAIKVDVRVIAATNRDLSAAIKDGRFREDLFYRLNGFPLLLPPLRDRSDDIEPLCSHVLAKEGKAGMSISAGAVYKLRTYRWPGNVRELENIIHRAAILAQGAGRQLIRSEDLPQQILMPEDTADPYIDLESQILEQLRRQQFSRSAIVRTAEALGNRDRGTITEYFRGMCFTALQKHNFDSGKAAKELAGDQASMEVLKRVENKIRRYLDNLSPLPEIDAADFDPRDNTAFRGLPASYHPALKAVIRHLATC